MTNIIYMPNYETRNIETSLNKIGKMIEEEDNAKDRSVLSVCHSLTLAIASMLDKMETSNAEHQKELAVHRDQLEEHSTIVLQGQTTLNIMKWFCGGMGGLVVLLSGYTYRTIDDMRLTLSNHSAIIPRIDVIVNELQHQRYEIAKNNEIDDRQDDVVQEQETAIKTQAAQVENVTKKLKVIDHNKVSKAPKYLIR